MKDVDYIYHPSHATRYDWKSNGNKLNKITIKTSKSCDKIMKIELYEDNRRIAFNYSTRENYDSNRKSLIRVFEKDKNVIVYTR